MRTDRCLPLRGAQGRAASMPCTIILIQLRLKVILRDSCATVRSVYVGLLKALPRRAVRCLREWRQLAEMSQAALEDVCLDYAYLPGFPWCY
jgi:hypothetical protein